MNTRDKVDWSTTPVRVNLTHKIQGYENHDKIEIPIIYTCIDSSDYRPARKPYRWIP